MNPKNNDESNSNLFYSSDDGKTWKPFCKASDFVTATSIFVDLSEESAAKLWAAIEGLEIVPRND